MSLNATRLAMIGLALGMTAGLSAQTPGGVAAKAQDRRDKATPAQVITLYDLRGVANSGGAMSTLMISGRGHAGTRGERRRAGITGEPEDVVHVIVATGRDPRLSRCLKLLVNEVFMEHVVQISGIGRFEPLLPGDRPPSLTLRLDALSECKAIPRQ